MIITSSSQVDNPYDASFSNKPQDIEAFLAKIYEENYEKISFYAKAIQFTQITSFLFAIIFLILLAIRVCPFASFSYLYLLIPSLISILSLLLMTNIFLLMKDLIDSPQRARDSSIQTGTVLSYLCFNSIGINALMLVILIVLKVQAVISSHWISLIIPLYLGCIIALFFVIFLSPAFISNHLYFDLALLFIDVICVFVFGVLLSYKLDNRQHYQFSITAIPVYFALGMNGFNLFLQSLLKKDVSLLSSMVMVVSLLCFLITVVLCQLKQDNVIVNENNWIEVAIGIIGFVALFSENVYCSFFDKDDEEDDGPAE